MGLQVTHQLVLYKIAPQAQSRITSIFVMAGFIGMSAGSALGSWSFAQAEWAFIYRSAADVDEPLRTVISTPYARLLSTERAVAYGE